MMIHSVMIVLDFLHLMLHSNISNPKIQNGETLVIPGRAAGPMVKGKPKGSGPPIDFYFVSYHSQSERNRYQTVTLDRQSIAFQEKRVCQNYKGSINQYVCPWLLMCCAHLPLISLCSLCSLFVRPCRKMAEREIVFKGQARTSEARGRGQ